MKNEVSTSHEESTAMAMSPLANQSPLKTIVRETMRQYFIKLDNQTPMDVYAMVLAEVESPLLETVLQHTRQNQSLAARILDMSRGTLRKKMAQYNLFKNKI